MWEMERVVLFIFNSNIFLKLLNLSFYAAGRKGCSVLRSQGQFVQ